MREAQEIRQLNIEKYRLAAHYLLQNIISEQKFHSLLIKKMENRAIDMDIFTFLDLNIEMFCSLHAELNLFKNHHFKSSGNRAIFHVKVYVKISKC